MPLTYFEGRLGLDQGRITPVRHSGSLLDNPQPAEVISTGAEPYALVDGQTLLVQVDGGTTQTVTFITAHFGDISAATAVEVAAAIAANLTGAGASPVSGRIKLLSDSAGPSASIRVVGGSAQSAFGFPNGLVSGTVGHYSFVLGADREMPPGRFSPGDYVQIEQFNDFGSTEILRIRGKFRHTPAPAGYGWNFVVTTNSIDRTFDDPATQSITISESSLDDLAINVSDLSGDQTLALRLEFVDLGGGGSDIEALLPAVYLDFLELDDSAEDLELGCRFPTPSSIGVPHDIQSLAFTVLNTTASALDLSQTQVIINGDLVYSAGAFQGAWTGSVAIGVGPSGRDTDFVVNLAQLAPVSSEDVVTVSVNTETGAGAKLRETYSWVYADTQAPQVVQAQARDKYTVRIGFNEPVLMDSSANGALNPDNYTISAVTVPAVPLRAGGCTMVGPSSVDITYAPPQGLSSALSWEATFGAEYRVQVDNVVDTSGNIISSSQNVVSYIAFTPKQPVGRDFSLWDRLPEYNRRLDVTGDLQLFLACLQDVVDILLCQVDDWVTIIDIDLAPELFVDAMLSELGNPFSWANELSSIDKRRLGRLLIEIYKEKGTAAGIINAVRFFMGVEITLDIVNDRDYWQLGSGFLGQNTYLAPGWGSPLWYSFIIESPLSLTEEQRARILAIADYMKPAHEHIIALAEPGEVSINTYWRLGVSHLGVDTYVGV